MANGIRFIRPSSGDAEEDDFFPALFAETYPLPATTLAARRRPSKGNRSLWIAARKERIA